jgi:cob(I)alamin adenosyltransferase
MRDILSLGEYKVVILDEANIALHFNLFSLDELIELIDCKADKTELIITGRNASPEILKRADLITEMKEIKHYYKEGVVARVGIEK